MTPAAFRALVQSMRRAQKIAIADARRAHVELQWTLEARVDAELRRGEGLFNEDEES